MTFRIAAIMAAVIAIGLAGGSASASTWLPEWIDKLVNPAPLPPKPADEMSRNHRDAADTFKVNKRKVKVRQPRKEKIKKSAARSRTVAEERKVKQERSSSMTSRARQGSASRSFDGTMESAPASTVKPIAEPAPVLPAPDASIEGGLRDSPRGVQIASAEEENELDRMADSLRIMRAFSVVRDEVPTVGQAEMAPETLPSPSEPQQGSWLRRIIAALKGWFAAISAFFVS